MTSDNNNLSLSYRSYDENRDTDIDVSITGDNVCDSKTLKLLNTFLAAIGSDLKVRDSRSGS